jgi:hypothetical protein
MRLSKTNLLADSIIPWIFVRCKEIPPEGSQYFLSHVVTTVFGYETEDASIRIYASASLLPTECLLDMLEAAAERQDAVRSDS